MLVEKEIKNFIRIISLVENDNVTSYRMLYAA